MRVVQFESSNCFKTMTATGRLWIEVLTKQNNTQLLGTGVTKQKTYNALTRMKSQTNYSKTLIDYKTYKQLWRQDSMQNAK